MDKRELNLLHREYMEKWGYAPKQENFLCSPQEYAVALKKALEENKKIETLLKTNPNLIKNQRLISSLNQTTSSASKLSDAQDKIINRKDLRATNNIAKLKSGEDHTNELRTVQSNKNLSKTRRAVIVRDNREHLPRTILAKTANFMSFVAVALVAIFLGVFVGNMFVAKGTLVDYSSVVEADYLPAYADVYTSNKTASKSSVNPANAYVMAEWQLLQQSGIVDSYSVVGTGSVRAKVSGIEQTQKVKKTVEKNADTMIVNNITKGLISTAEKSVLDISDNKISSYVTKSVNDALEPGYSENPTKTYDLNTEYDDFRKEYGITPYAFFPYLVSIKTVEKGEYLGEQDGGHKYRITLNNITGVVNYVQYMAHTSDLKRLPTFYNLTIIFVVDNDYRFLSADVEEKYQVYYLGLPADTESAIHFDFSY